MSAVQANRGSRRQKCFLCDLPKSSWTILGDFSQPVCRGCVNYEGLDRVEDAINESRRLRDLEGGGLAGPPTAKSCVTGTSSLTSPLDTTTIAQVDSSNHPNHVSGPRFEPATPQSADAVDFLGAADLQSINSAGLPTNTIVGTSSAPATTNPAAPTAARADSSAPSAFDDFPSPLTPYSPVPDWNGRGNAYGGALRVMDTTGYAPYNPLATQEYMRPNPYGGYIAAHDSAFTYYGGWRAMKRSGPEDALFNPYATPTRPGSIPPRRISEPSPAAKRLDKGSLSKSPTTIPTTTSQSPSWRSPELSSDHVITIAPSPVSKTTKDKLPSTSDKETLPVATVTVTDSNKKDAPTVAASIGASRDKKSTSKSSSSSSPESSGSATDKQEQTAGSSNTAAASSGSKPDSDMGNKNSQSTSASGDLTADGESISSRSSSSGNANSKQEQCTTSTTAANTTSASASTATATTANGDSSAAAGQKSCNHCGCGLASVQYVQCPSVERHRYCLFCTYMHIEWSDPGAVSCPSKQRCLHPTSNVPWVFLPNEIESIRKAVQLSETPAIMQ